MRRFLKSIALALAICAAISSPAHAIPATWRGTPRFTRENVTYRVRGHDAVVVATRGKRVTIPAEVRFRGKWYEVKNVWPGALRGARVVTIHADLDGCDCQRLWRVRVRVTRRGMYRWLKSTDAHVTKIHCSDCE